jgi:CubicO group peptidase (beta-lactamase class C family)
VPDRQSTRATRAGLSGPPLATLLLLAAASITAAQPPALSTSPPEAQGVSTTRLFASADSVGLLPKARALLVARHGTLILERYYRGMSADSIWDMKSVTKSVQSALIGIAIGDHLVAGLDARVAGAMPDRFPMLPVGLDLTFASWIAGNDSLHRTVTVRDLLTMGADSRDPTWTSLTSCWRSMPRTRFGSWPSCRWTRCRGRGFAIGPGTRCC